jgi:hypothetical protein
MHWFWMHFLAGTDAAKAMYVLQDVHHFLETLMIYAAPGAAGAKVQYKSRYDNFIGGQFVAPVKGQYFDVITPISGKVYTQAARSDAADIELALDAAHKAADAWGKTSPTERSNILLKIADRIEANLEMLAYAETVDAQRRHPTHRGPLPLLRRLRACARRRAV